MTDYKWKDAGMKLRALRKETGLSIFKVAKQNHISGNYLSLLERGKQSPSNTVIYNLSSFYNIPAADLFALYGKLEPTETERIINAPPNLRKLLTEMSIDKRISDEEMNDIYDAVYKLTLDMKNNREDD